MDGGFMLDDELPRSTSVPAPTANRAATTSADFADDEDVDAEVADSHAISAATANQPYKGRH